MSIITKGQKVIRHIYKTMDYSLFKTIEGNRDTIEPHVENIKKSMIEKQLLIPIMINKFGEIIDGEHRFSAQKSLNLPVYYIINHDYGLKEVKKLNHDVKVWSKLDYLDSYCKSGNDHYIKLREVYEKFPKFTLKTLEVLLSGHFYGTDSGSSESRLERNGFKNGRFMIMEGKYEKIYDWLGKLTLLSSKGINFNQRGIPNVFTELFEKEEFDLSKFLSKMDQAHGVEFHKLVTAKEILEAADYVYNYNGNKVNYVKLTKD